MPLDIKICGLKTPETVAATLEGGASHIGFVFFPPSPRNLAPGDAAVLRKAAGDRAKVVAVTVDADDAFLGEIVQTVGPDILQLHGCETPERVAAVKARWKRPVMKAFSLREPADLQAVAAYADVADFLLFDAKPPAGAKLPGGNGHAFDWGILSGFSSPTPWFLSGGLHSGNVEEAVRIAGPSGIDVSSGVELAPGRKDIGLIGTFLSAARANLAARAA